MRRLILIAAAATVLSACGKNGQQDANQLGSENLTAESIVSNDVTAIDAVTGDAANMAADVDLNFGNLEMNGVEATSSEPAQRPAPKKPTLTISKSPAISKSSANSVANATTNAE